MAIMKENINTQQFKAIFSPSVIVCYIICCISSSLAAPAVFTICAGVPLEEAVN